MATRPTDGMAVAPELYVVPAVMTEPTFAFQEPVVVCSPVSFVVQHSDCPLSPGVKSTSSEHAGAAQVFASIAK